MTQHILKIVNFCFVQLSNMLHQNHLFEINTAGSVTWFNKSHEMNFHNWLTAFKACNLSFGILNLKFCTNVFHEKKQHTNLTWYRICKQILCKFNCWSLTQYIYIHTLLNTPRMRKKVYLVRLIVWFFSKFLFPCPLRALNFGKSTHCLF